MPNSPSLATVQRYGLGVVSVALVAMLRLELDWTLGANLPMLFLFLIPVGLSAWYGGFGPGIAATVIGGLADALFFQVNPESSLSSVLLIRSGLYLSTGLAVSYIGACLRSARKQERESETRYRGILESVSDGVWQFDSRMTTTYANSAMARLVGCSVDELLGRPFADFLATQHSGHGSDPLTLFNTDAPVDIALRRKDGTTVWALLSARPLWDQAGAYTGSIATATDISERRRREETLKILSARLQSAREAEASRIAREIHDELGASLTSLRWDLEWVEAALEKGSIAGVREKVARLVSLADGTVTTVRRIASDLRPAVVDDLGLVSALQWYSEQFRERTGIVVEFRAKPVATTLPYEIEIAAFRIFQEALTNVLRHSQATRVEISIAEKGDDMILEICDNGCGLESGARLDAGSLGLVGMHERASLVGGRISIEPFERGGTRVAVTIPVRLCEAAEGCVSA